MTMKERSLKFIEYYQTTLSKRKPKNFKCPYQPSCSEYTKQAITKYGAFKGWRMGIWRILRCNPRTKGGYDPVK